MRDINLFGFEFKNKPEGGWHCKVNGLWVAIACYALYCIYCWVTK